MIAPELMNKLQQLNREEKLEVIRLLQDDLSDEMRPFVEGRRVFKIPSVRFKPGTSASVRKMFEEILEDSRQDE